MDSSPHSPAAACLARRQHLIAVEGVVSIITAESLLASSREALASGDEVRVDAARVERLDGAALQVLAALVRGLQKQGRSLRWTAISPAALECIDLAGLRTQLALDPTTAIAAAAENFR